MPNRLISEKSPYLQQHAHNPVDWYPWGDEAFEKARRENKPIFLSIGYSTCHWCHVMERESFESDQIAALLNTLYVPVKVDREERPDVDHIYMTYVQAATGGGGWPMSVFLTPDLKPFFGGTYFAPDSRYGQPGFGAILQRIADSWSKQHDQIIEAGDSVIGRLKDISGAGRPEQGVADQMTLDSTFQYFRRIFDAHHGGFGDSPKFPRPVVFNFLLRYHDRSRRKEALDMTVDTLRARAAGGMHDQLGGGFHRYSVDDRWFVPHFEKMLYDQAQLAVSYLETYQVTHDEFFATIARSTLDYVLRDMTDPSGGFYSAEDADSVIDPAHPKEKGEGAFYIWSYAELEQILGAATAEIVAYHYGAERNGNVDSDPHGEFTGKNIFYAAHSLADTAQKSQLSEDAVSTQLHDAAKKLLAARAKRVRPHLDDKILTGWNSLMISAFAKAAAILHDRSYLDAAQRAASFIASRMYDPATGVLKRRYRDGDAAIHGFLDDYANFIAALLDLYAADFDPAHIELAITLANHMLRLFEDSGHGAFFTTIAGDASLILRMKDDYDGAEPSANSIALLDLLRLAHFTDRQEFRDAASRTLQALAPRMGSQPVAVPQMLVGLDYSLAAKREVVIAGARDTRTQAMLAEFHRRFLPYTIALLIDSGETRSKLASFFPTAGAMHEIDNKPAAYVCQNYACQLPTTELPKFVELLQ